MNAIYAALAACLCAPLFLWALRKYMNRLVEKRIAGYQNELVARHCAEVENIYKQMRGWRHDYHNHMQAMKACLALGQTEEMRQYLNRLDSDLTNVDTILKTGNVMVDAILNSKLSLARAQNISVNAKAVVPGNLTVQDIDLCVVIGNLLDNAIEACLKQPDAQERFIRAYIGTRKEMLYISVSNSMSGEARKSGKSFLSTKASPTHGFGLVRIDKIAEKYGGFVNRQSESGVFAAEVLLAL